MAGAVEIWSNFRTQYKASTPKKIQVIDYFLVFTVRRLAGSQIDAADQLIDSLAVSRRR